MKTRRGCKVQEKTVAFDRAGNFRVSFDLLRPEMLRKAIAFSVNTIPAEKQGGVVILEPILQSETPRGRLGGSGYIVKAWMPSRTSKSPMASGLSILRSLNLRPPKKSKIYLATVEKAGAGRIRFEI